MEHGAWRLLVLPGDGHRGVRPPAGAHLPPVVTGRRRDGRERSSPHRRHAPAQGRRRRRRRRRRCYARAARRAADQFDVALAARRPSHRAPRERRRRIAPVAAGGRRAPGYGHEDRGNGRAAIALRVPSWAEAPTATLNGGAVGERAVPGSYLRVERAWRTGDSLALSLPTRLRAEPLPDSRPMYSSMVALLHGPLVLACVGCRATAVAADATALLSTSRPSSPAPTGGCAPSAASLRAAPPPAPSSPPAGGCGCERASCRRRRSVRRGAAAPTSGAVTFSVSAGLAPGTTSSHSRRFSAPAATSPRRLPRSNRSSSSCASRRAPSRRRASAGR